MKWVKPKIVDRDPELLHLLRRVRDACLQEADRLRKQAAEIRAGLKEQDG